MICILPRWTDYSDAGNIMDWNTAILLVVIMFPIVQSDSRLEHGNSIGSYNVPLINLSLTWVGTVLLQ